jgi:hypothetical protein
MEASLTQLSNYVNTHKLRHIFQFIVYNFFPSRGNARAIVLVLSNNLDLKSVLKEDVYSTYVLHYFHIFSPRMLKGTFIDLVHQEIINGSIARCGNTTQPASMVRIIFPTRWPLALGPGRHWSWMCSLHHWT